jgi:hypothetical protein
LGSYHSPRYLREWEKKKNSEEKSEMSVFHGMEREREGGTRLKKEKQKTQLVVPADERGHDRHEEPAKDGHAQAEGGACCDAFF